MYWCEECGHEVSSPRYVKVEEVHWEVDTRRIEEMESVVCPDCGHELVEAENCEICGEYIAPDKILCEWCEDVMDFEYDKMIATIAERCGCDTETAFYQFDEWLCRH